MSKLSIITINFNNAKGLEKTIQSVVEQSFEDYEFIIIDGGSTDGSVDVIKKHALGISHWVSEKDNGIYNAQNKGIKAAKGEYVLFLNSGDHLAEKDILKKVFSKNPTADIAYGNMYIVYEGGRMEKGFMPSHISFHQMIKDTLWHPVSFIKRNLFETYGLYKEEFKIVADYEFFLNAIIVKKASTQYLNEFISVFMHDGKSSSMESVTQIKLEREKAQLQYFDKSVIDEEMRKIKLENEIPKTFTQKLIAIFKK